MLLQLVLRVHRIWNPLRRLGRRLRLVRLPLGGIFDLAPGVLHFAFDLFRCPLRLLLGVAGPFSNLTFNTSRHVFYLALHSIFIHAILLGNTHTCTF